MVVISQLNRADGQSRSQYCLLGKLDMQRIVRQLEKGRLKLL